MKRFIFEVPYSGTLQVLADNSDEALAGAQEVLPTDATIEGPECVGKAKEMVEVEEL